MSETQNEAPSSEPSASTVMDERGNTETTAAQQETMLDVCPTGGDIDIGPMNKKMKIHETAKAFPSLPAKDAADLKANIEKNGISVPILLNQAADTILDGRNRWMMALDLGLRKSQVPVERFTGDEAAIPGVIISRNLFRRHLNDKQRAALVTKLLGPQLEEEAAAREKAGKALLERYPEFTGGSKASYPEFTTGSKTVDKLAKVAGVSPHKTRQAVKVRKAGGDKALDDIISGKTDLTKVAKSVPTKRRRPAKTLTFSEQVWRKWSSWLVKWLPADRRKVKELIAGYLKDDTA